MVIEEEKRRKLTPWGCFGDIALLYNSPRSATVRALEYSTMFGVDRVSFKRALGEIISRVIDKSRKFLDIFRLFEYFDEYQKDSISGLMILQKFSKNEYITHESDQASAFYILKEGSIVLERNKQEFKRIKPGEVFGESSLDFEPSINKLSSKALDNVKVFAISAVNLIDILGERVLLMRFEGKIKETLSKSKHLIKTSPNTLQKILQALSIKDYEEETLRITKLDRIWILLTGNIKLSGGRVLKNEVIIGDYSIFEENEPLLKEEDIEMVINGYIASLPYVSLLKILSSTHAFHERKTNLVNERKEVVKIQLDDLIFIKNFGEGLFGPIFLVKNDETNKFFVLKCVSKAVVCEKNLEKHIIQEMEVMEKISHVFIVKFYQCIKDVNLIYFLNEYVRGLELFDFIKDMGLLTKKYSRFYIASLISVFEYLHSIYIVYRDLKPENILIDESGYIKVIDFGIAKSLNNKKSLRTFTIVGTPHYMAPEIVKGKGYSFQVDLWSLGIVMYELMCGGLPFAEDSENPYEIYEEIIKSPLGFPKFLKDRHAISLMTQLLNKIPEMRMEGSYEDLKGHPWFENLQWEKLEAKELEAPYIPDEDKLLSNKEIQKLYKNKENLLDFIKNDDNPVFRRRYRKEKARDQNWDKKF